jgi:phosphatidylglycerol:prolipoprotein diacylglycerol transferase
VAQGTNIVAPPTGLGSSAPIASDAPRRSGPGRFWSGGSLGWGTVQRTFAPGVTARRALDPMYPTLYHAVHSLFGLDLQALKLINTFGFLVALAFLGAAWSLALELDRKHAQGKLKSAQRKYVPPRPPTLVDVGVSGLMAFLLGFKLFGIVLGEFKLQGGADTQRYLLSMQGHWLAGIVCGVGWMVLKVREWRVQNEQTPPADQPEFVEITPRDHVLGITGAAALGGLIGAKLFHLLERPKNIIELIEHPSVGAIFSGLTIYGGLIMGALFVYRYCRKHNLPFVHIADAVAPGLMLGYGIGRLGCQLAGDGDWGIPSAGAPSGFGWLPSWFWAFDYPNNVLGSGVPMPSGGYPGYGMHLVPPVYPTPLYESLAAFLIFALLWSVRKRIERPLVMFGLYMVLNGIERFLIEKIRVNAVYELFGKTATQAELIAVLMFFGGLALMFIQMRKPLPTPVVPAASAASAPETPAPTD